MLDISEKVSDFVSNNPLNEDAKKLQSALLLYPYIHNEMISHGYAAKLLGMDRLSLIDLYESIGIPYHVVSSEELEDEVSLYNSLKGELG